jgi:hypothetical protein
MNGSNARVFLLTLVSIILASTGFASAQIVAFGHSAVRGHVAENEMWPAVLESMLRARGSQVHVINAGVNGETTDRGSSASIALSRKAPSSSSCCTAGGMMVTRAQTVDPSPVPPTPVQILRR